MGGSTEGTLKQVTSFLGGEIALSSATTHVLMAAKDVAIRTPLQDCHESQRGADESELGGKCLERR